VYQIGTKLEIGKGLTLRNGQDLTLVATGAMVGRCARAAEELALHGIEARLLEIHTLKPLDRDLLLQAAGETGALVTAEDHNIIGGWAAQWLKHSRSRILSRWSGLVSMTGSARPGETWMS